jgi:homoserine O-succinyltransferase/O-acetyltransferase
VPVAITRSIEGPTIANLRERRLQRGVIGDRGRRLRVALVNNMPDSALFSTQRQFIRLLEAGAAEFEVTLAFMSMTSVPRSEEAVREMAGLYRAASQLAADAPDAVIVTGAEPREEELEQERYWQELCGLFDVARRSAYSTLASCLAAHAFALRLDGVRRRRFARKWSGLYPTEIVGTHPLTEGVAAGPMPHSRWNGLDASDLVAKGYTILTTAGEAGVDMFVKEDDHLSLFIQGHPEYESDTLAREFRRDVARALAGAPPPHVPDNYYSPAVERRIGSHVERMIAGVEAPHLPQEAMIGPEATWRARGAKVIGNWLQSIRMRKLASNGGDTLRRRQGE